MRHDESYRCKEFVGTQIKEEKDKGRIRLDRVGGIRLNGDILELTRDKQGQTRYSQERTGTTKDKWHNW